MTEGTKMNDQVLSGGNNPSIVSDSDQISASDQVSFSFSSGPTGGPTGGSTNATTLDLTLSSNTPTTPTNFTPNTPNTPTITPSPQCQISPESRVDGDGRDIPNLPGAGGSSQLSSPSGNPVNPNSTGINAGKDGGKVGGRGWRCC